MNTIRRFVPGVVYHLIWRFVDRSWFFNRESERERYLQLLAHGLSETDWRCLAFALMSNHIHLAMVAGSEALCSWSRRANAPFASWMNAEYDRLGPLFAHAVRDYAVVPAAVGKLIAYIHNNPVEAKVVARARDSRWTSHRAYVGLAPQPSWLHIDEGLRRTGVDRDAFDAWVNKTPGDPGMVDVDEIGRVARRRGALAVATPSTAVIPLVGRPFAHVRVSPQTILAIAAELAQLRLPVICSRNRGPAALAARRAVVHAGRMLGLSITELATSLGLSSTAVAKIARRALAGIEEQLVANIIDRVELARVA